MAAPSRTSDQNSRKNTNYNPELDFFSDKFDPMKALTTPGLTPPVPEAGAYDNLSKYESVMRGARTVAPPVRNEPTTSFERRFLPHQMPVKGARRAARTVFTKMAAMEGPLAVLRRVVEERIRVKVFTRNAYTIRGHCLAFVVAFDKHWNMALEDVTEIWTRKSTRKVPALGELVVKEGGVKNKRITPPPIQITRLNKKSERCERHVPQLLLRGEDVVFVSVLDNKTDN